MKGLKKLKVDLCQFIALFLKLKDKMKALDDVKNKQESVWSNVFWCVKVCIFWKCIQYTIHWGKTQTLKRISFGQNKRYKNAPFFLLRAPTHRSFTFNLSFLYKLKYKARVSKTVSGIFEKKLPCSFNSYHKTTFFSMD